MGRSLRTSEAGLAPPPTAGLTLKTVGTLASLEAGPGPPRPTHRGSSTTRAGGPGVWVCSLGAQTRHSTCTKSTGPQLPRPLEAPAKACEAEKGGGGLRCPAAAHPSPGPVPRDCDTWPRGEPMGAWEAVSPR